MAEFSAPFHIDKFNTVYGYASGRSVSFFAACVVFSKKRMGKEERRRDTIYHEKRKKAVPWKKN